MTGSSALRARAAGVLGCMLLVLGLAAGTTPAAARILKTRRPRENSKPLALTMGSGFEYETDGEESEYGFPFLAEYGLTDWLKLGAEPSWIFIRRKAGGQVSSPGDLETTLTFDLPTERRYRPGLAFESVIKWPTARSRDLGTGKTDYSFGAILSKEFVRFDLDANAIYTVVGNPEGLSLNNTFEASLASEWHLRPGLALEGEFVTAMGSGGRFRGHSGSLGGFANIGGPEQGQSESEFTLGLAESRSEFLKFEQGVIMKSGGSWQFVIAWEYDFAGGR